MVTIARMPVIRDRMVCRAAWALLAVVVLCTAESSAQQTRLDWKVHDVGRVRQVITNAGALNAVGDGLYTFPGLLNCEYPPNSRQEHIADGGIWIGAVLGNDSATVDTFVSVTEGEGSPKEFFPGPEPSDSIWVVSRGDTVDIPYWPGYVGVSDQDFVCKYTDYGPVSLRVDAHTPLYLEVIQTSYAWSSPPLDEFIVLNYFITSTRLNLEQVYLTSWVNGNEGYIFAYEYALDDQSFFRQEYMMQFAEDVPGGADALAYGPIGDKVFPPPTADSLRLTYQWYNGRQQGLPSRDGERYQQMTSGTIMEDQQTTFDGTKSQVSFGPYRLHVGDTLHFVRVLVLGKGLEGVLQNARYVDVLITKNFQVPSPPPSPQLRATATSHGVRLDWTPQPGEVNPELYTDAYRADSITQPFEGYRVYKSTRSNTGPWTLLAEYDIPGNPFGQNTGLAYQYPDSGLLNNFEYFYSVTAFSKRDTVTGFPSQESSVSATAIAVVPGPPPPGQVGSVAVVPNPYRGDVQYYAYNPPWEKPTGTRDNWMEQDRRVQFINLPEQCTVRVYTLAGDLVTTLQHSSATRGYEDWNLTSSIGQAIASGIYLFSVEDTQTGDVQVGKFVVIK